jgi:hypothetical protein
VEDTISVRRPAPLDVADRWRQRSGPPGTCRLERPYSRQCQTDLRKADAVGTEQPLKLPFGFLDLRLKIARACCLIVAR